MAKASLGGRDLRRIVELHDVVYDVRTHEDVGCAVLARVGDRQDWFF